MCRFWKGIVAFAVTLIVLQSAAVTIHRSFRSREVGFGGGASASVPVDSKVAAALDEAAEKEAAKVNVIVGKVSRVSDGDTIWVVGNQLPTTNQPTTKYKVRLDRIDAPEKDQPYGKESTAYLAKLIKGRIVRVEWVKKDQYGRILGIVYLPSIEQSNKPNNRTIRQDINLTMVVTGNAWHYSYFDKTAEYASAEAEARQKKLGLWQGENPINPYEWRKNKRRM